MDHYYSGPNSFFFLMINNVYIMTDHAELYWLFSIICILVKHCNRVAPKYSKQVFCSTDTLQLRKLLFREQPYPSAELESNGIEVHANNSILLWEILFCPAEMDLILCPEC